MEIVIRGSSKEIADLVSELQGRQEKEPMIDGQIIADQHLQMDPSCTDLKIGLSGKCVG